jgi:hypothetical protein
MRHAETSDKDQTAGSDGQAVDRTVAVFYRTARAGASRLADGGGPFGFDIAIALLADQVITAYQCQAIAETGCFLGDTASYLARRYPQLPVYTCDTEPGFARFTAHRLAGCPNLTISCEDSPAMLARVSARHDRVFAFLDAHWADRWPLIPELDTLTSAVAMIHDFDIGHERFSYDTYSGIVCGPAVLAAMSDPPDRYFTFDPAATLPVPCLQTGRRAGVAVLAIGLGTGPLENSPYLASRSLAGTAGPAREPQ